LAKTNKNGHFNQSKFLSKAKLMKTQDLRFNKKFIWFNFFILRFALNAVWYILFSETSMKLLQSILIRFGLADLSTERSPISIFLLDDDTRRHRWFKKRFDGDEVFIAETVDQAKVLLEENSYDAIFLDHDLLPEHYDSDTQDDENTGFAIAIWLSENKNVQSAATIIVHTRNSDGGMRMVEVLRGSARNVEYVPFPLLDTKIKHYWKR
jgi:hypothetical protein